MEFYIGGYAQGKLRYVMQEHQGEDLVVIDGADMDKAEMEMHRDGRLILNHFHLWVKRMMEKRKDPTESLTEILTKYEDCIIISDEIGNGIVPASQQERDYREQVGRLQIELAAKAEKVERVICGIGQRIK